MQKLNKLVELAKKADREVTWSLLPFDLAKEGWCVEVVDYIAAMTPCDILVIAEYVRELTQRAEAAEAKRAELNKQEPVGWLVGLPGLYPTFTKDYRNVAQAEKVGGYEITPVFTRPAPAVNLAALVPLVPPKELRDQLFKAYGSDDYAVQCVWNICCAEIKSKIEEAKK